MGNKRVSGFLSQSIKISINLNGWCFFSYTYVKKLNNMTYLPKRLDFILVWPIIGVVSEREREWINEFQRVSKD